MFPGSEHRDAINMISVPGCGDNIGPRGASLRIGALTLLAAGLWAGTAGAQPFDAVGARARGMGGAFVAVADDASATWWNPAGLPNSLILDGVIDLESTQVVDDGQLSSREGGGGLRTRAAGLGFAFPALGLSYYRVRQSEVGPATGGIDPGRQDPGTTSVARSLLSQQFGISLVQSLGDAVVVGATARLVRGSVGSVRYMADIAAGDALNAAGETDGPSVTRGDADVGVLVRISRVRVGLAARNLAAPRFHDAEGTPWQLDRLARAGVALVGDADRAGRQEWVVAVDADLTRTPTPVGDRRDVALGAERWFHERRVGVRGGVRASTADQARPVVSGGASLAVAGGVWIEAEATGGADRTATGLGISAHVMF
jgi:F plasmid transfer operon, TraF, protein